MGHDTLSLMRGLPALLFAAACAPEVRLDVRLPDLAQDTRSVAVVLEEESSVVEVRLLRHPEPSADPLISRQFDETHGAIVASILTSKQTLDELGLTEGVLPPAGSGPARSLVRVMSGPHARLAIVDDRASDWDWESPPTEAAQAITLALESSLCERPTTEVWTSFPELGVNLRSAAFGPDGVLRWVGSRLELVEGSWVESPAGGKVSRKGSEIEYSPTVTLDGTKEMLGLVRMRDSYYSWDRAAEFVVLDGDFNVRRKIAAPRWDEYMLVGGLDGSLFATALIAGTVLELVEGSSVAVERLDFPKDTRALALIDRNHGVAFTGTAIPPRPPNLVPSQFEDGRLWRLEDGVWTPEARVEGAVVFPSVFAQPNGIGATINADIMIRESQGDWRTITGTDLDSPSTPKNQIVFLRGGRMMVFGDVATAKIHDPRQGWCSSVVGTNRNFEYVATDADLRVIVGFDGGDFRYSAPGYRELAGPSILAWYELDLP
ncbi:MAG: hypothetical protein HY791_02435 [Deltaproteobacteria bacterium]|nr:hypothetical protein [Deltaproteobacteria bacterium]